jgi:sugar lactone lactonase YvrE
MKLLPRRGLVVLGLAAATALLGLMVGPVGASSHVEKIIAFAEADHPEGIAFNQQGDMFVSINSGAVRVVRAGGNAPEPFGFVPGIEPATDTGVLGLATDASGDVYAAVESANPQANGVWVFDRWSGRGTHIAGTEALAFANGLAFDKQGNLYVTESWTGTIWRITRDGDLNAWFRHPSLEGTGALAPTGRPTGANGIAYHDGTLYVANSEQFSLVAVPITPSGEPGTPSTVIVFDPIEVSPGVVVPAIADGVALDVQGDIYVTLLLGNAIARVSPDGTAETIASGGLLDGPANLAFGSRNGERKTLFVANYSTGELFGLDPRTEQGVLAIDVGIPGDPLP